MKVFEETISHPLMANRNQVDFQTKLQTVMAKNGIDMMLLSQKTSIYYATGYYGASMALVPAKGVVHLIVSDLEVEASTALTRNVEIEAFASWVFLDDGTPESLLHKEADIDPLTAVRKALGLIADYNPKAVVGIEMGSISVNVWQYLMSQIGTERLVDCTGSLMEARLVKTPWEIDMLRIAAQHSEKMMRITFEKTHAGMTLAELERIMLVSGLEIDDLKTSIKMPTIIATGGEQYAVSGLPRSYKVKDGDLVRLDGGFCHLGYMGDLGRTYVVGGKPSPVQDELYEALYEGHKAGIQMFKPGVKLSEVYNKVISVVESSNILKKYPRGHVGHSIGIEPRLEEYPQISPDATVVMQPGMVFSFETPYYGNKNATITTGPINIEDSLVITETGMERFTFVNDNLRWN